MTPWYPINRVQFCLRYKPYLLIFHISLSYHWSPGASVHHMWIAAYLPHHQLNAIFYFWIICLLCFASDVHFLARQSSSRPRRRGLPRLLQAGMAGICLCHLYHASSVGVLCHRQLKVSRNVWAVQTVVLVRRPAASPRADVSWGIWDHSDW